MDAAKRAAYDGARAGGRSGDFGASREDLFRDLFADPRASAIFEELARELGRMGTRVERRDFERTLFGGRVVLTGGVFVLTPLTPARLLWRLSRAAVRGARAAERAESPALPARGGLLARALEAGRRLLGLGGTASAAADGDVTFPLRLTALEAGQGTRKRVTLRRGDGDDAVVVTVPAGTRPGTRLRLRGKGRARPDGARGDAYLAVEVAAEG
jgi:curved DNA-binding protein